MKYSKQRELILETLRQNPCHPTAETLFALVRQKDSSVSLATVYRNLNQLAANGLIRKLEHLDNVARFDHNLTKHYHFICSECAAVMDIDSDIAAGIEQRLAEQTGLAVECADIFLRGICPNCLKHKTN